MTSFPGGEPPLARHHRPTPEWRSVSADPTSSPSNFDLTERRLYSACFDRLSLPLLEDTFVACSLRIPRFKVYDIFLLFLLIFGDFLLIFLFRILDMKNIGEFVPKEGKIYSYE